MYAEFAKSYPLPLGVQGKGVCECRGVNSVITFLESKPLDRKATDEIGRYSADTKSVNNVIATVFLHRYCAYSICYSIRSQSKPSIFDPTAIKTIS